MKTLTDLLELTSKAIEQTDKGKLINEEKLYHVFFIRFSGHVNLMTIEYFPIYDSNSKDNRQENCQGYLNNEDNIQELYWFLKNRIRG